MRILITGGKGFIGRSFYWPLSAKHAVFTPGHKELDVLDLPKLERFIEVNEIECVIHAATLLSRKYAQCGADSVYYMLLMFENILHASRNCKLLINFGSGEEFDTPNRRESELRVISKASGFSKYVITRRILSVDNPKCFNLRFCGCFGIHEKEDRFVKNNLRRTMLGQPILIHQDRKMDFIYVDDLLKITQYTLEKYNTTPRDINCSYLFKYTLMDIAVMIQEVTGVNYGIIIEKDGYDKEYTIDPSLLYSLGIEFCGIKAGIEKMYTEMLNADYANRSV